MEAIIGLNACYIKAVKRSKCGFEYESVGSELELQQELKEYLIIDVEFRPCKKKWKLKDLRFHKKFKTIRQQPKVPDAGRQQYDKAKQRIIKSHD